MKGNVILRPVNRREKRDALNVVPVEMGQKDFGVDGRAVGFLHQSLAEGADAAAGIEDHALVFRRADLEARRVAAELQVLNLRSGRGAAHTPEFEPYLSAIH